jgi:S-phase kinase-associated protein 1
MVKLLSSDGTEFEVERSVACHSMLIKNMLEDVGEEEDQPIPLSNVSGLILSKGTLIVLMLSDRICQTS